jgi:hypothetical protein
MKKAFNWYDSCLAGSDEELMSEVQKVADFIKNQDWFNLTFAQTLVDMLADISKADGEVIDNEKGSLESLAKYWGVVLDWAITDDLVKQVNEESKSSSSSDKFSFDDYITIYNKEHPNEKQDENLLRATVDFVFETVEGTDGLLEVFSRTGGYSVNANNKLKNGKFAQVRWSKSDRKESKPVRYFVDLYLLKSKMDYKIDTLANQSLQSPHAHEFYMIRLYSQDDLDNFRQYQSLIMDSLKARQKNKLITKRKNLSKKQLKEEFLRDLGVS